MDSILNIRAFLATARAGSISRAAKQLGVAPSVVAKRLNRLEAEMHARLLVRTTRRLELTETGERCVRRFQTLVAELDDALASAKNPEHRVEGHLRVKCPTAFATIYFDEILNDFQLTYPEVQLEIVLMDRPANPIEENFDLVLDPFSASYADVMEVPLCPYPASLYASPSYLDRRGKPRHPSDLEEHDCIVFSTTGPLWSFESKEGPISVTVRSHLTTNDLRVLSRATLKGVGIARISHDIARASEANGQLVALLSDFRIRPVWLKMQIPKSKMKRAAVLALLEWIGDRVQLPSSTEGEAGTPGPVAAVSQMTAAEARPRRGI